jgi:hypothetical protein
VGGGPRYVLPPSLQEIPETPTAQYLTPESKTLTEHKTLAQTNATEFGYKSSRWVWESSAAGPVLSHTSHPPYKIVSDRFKTVADLVFWLGHLGEKKWVTKDDLYIVAARFEEHNRG